MTAIPYIINWCPDDPAPCNPCAKKPCQWYAPDSSTPAGGNTHAVFTWTFHWSKTPCTPVWALFGYQDQSSLPGGVANFWNGPLIQIPSPISICTASLTYAYGGTNRITVTGQTVIVPSGLDSDVPKQWFGTKMIVGPFPSTLYYTTWDLPYNLIPDPPSSHAYSDYGFVFEGPPVSGAPQIVTMTGTVSGGGTMAGAAGIDCELYAQIP